MSISNALTASILGELEQGEKTGNEIVVLTRKFKKGLNGLIVIFAVMIVTCCFIREVKTSKEMDKEEVDNELDKGVEMDNKK